MIAKLYERCPSCKGTGVAPQFCWSGAPACPCCRGAKFVETGLTAGHDAAFAMEIDRIKAECRQRRESAGLGGPTEAELIEVGAVTLTCLDTLAARVNDDDLADYVAEVASRLETVLRKLGWEPKQREAK